MYPSSSRPPPALDLLPIQPEVLELITALLVGLPSFTSKSDNWASRLPCCVWAFICPSTGFFSIWQAYLMCSTLPQRWHVAYLKWHFAVRLLLFLSGSIQALFTCLQCLGLLQICLKSSANSVTFWRVNLSSNSRWCWMRSSFPLHIRHSLSTSSRVIP